MSEFRRTTSGLNNQHLFFNVDLIVFLEGGSVSYNKEQVYAGNYSSETEDVIFWGNIFKKFKGDSKVKFKSVGSKSTLKEVAIDIINGRLTTAFVAMDNEFDEVLNLRIDHPSVFYTFGYSWENDVWNKDVIKAIVEELSAIMIENNDIANNFNTFLKKIRIAVHADAYLFKHGSSFFNRSQGLMFCVDCDPVDLPSIKSKDIEDKIIAKGVTMRKATLYGNKKAIDTLKFCFGHFLAGYCCQVIKHYLKKRHSLTNISNGVLYRMSIKKFFDHQFEDGQIYNHYYKQFERIA